MKIPARLQLFDQPVKIRDADVFRLRSHLSGWPHLNEILLLGVSEADLRRLLVLELVGFRRRLILDRLMQRLVRTYKAGLKAKVAKVLGA